MKRWTFPASAAQELLWHNNSPNVAITVAVPGADPERIEAALRRVVARHEILRTHLTIEDGRLVQVVSSSVPIELDVVDPAIPIPIDRPPLWRARLAQDHLLFVAHPAIFDHHSAELLAAELTSFATRPDADLPELAVQYADFAAWQQTQPFDADLAFWKHHLASAPPLTLPLTDHPRPARPHPERASVTAPIPAATPQPVLIAAMAALLSRMTNADDLVIGTVTSHRTLPELQPLVGAFDNPIALRLGTADNPTFEQLLESTIASLDDSFAHSKVPFQQVAALFTGDPAIPPVFQVSVQGGAATDLSLALEGNTCRLSYRTALFDRNTAEAMLGRFVRLLTAAVADPQQRISDLPFLDESERDFVVEEHNQTGHPFTPATLPSLFEAQVEATPDRVAVVCEGVELTYAQLNAAANRLARQLLERGAAPETLVGLAMPRTAELVVAILAVLKTGAGYLPLETDYPPDRLAFMVEDAKPLLLLTRGSVPSSVPTLDIEGCLEQQGDPGNLTDADRVAPLRPANLAYIVYTSGSTGRPKGVVAEHRTVHQHLDWALRVYPSLRGTVLLHSPVSFDLTVPALFCPLISGGQLRIAALDSPAARVGGRPDFLKATPSHLPLITDDIAPTGNLVFGGETLPPDALRNVRAAHPGVTVTNGYGPTEITVSCMAAHFAPGDPQPDGPVPIGHPSANMRAYVLDTHLRPVPPGVVGELYLAGKQVARGYLNRPGLTAEKFLPCPFGEPGQRMYRTGDLVRRLPNGMIDFLGRADSQIKLRGHRIEPGEIESCLREHVADAVVQLEGGTDGHLVAYLVLAGEPPTPAGIRAGLADLLPPYMIPAEFRVVHAIPLNPSGKIDQRALRGQGEPLTSTAVRPPATPTARLVAEIFAGLLRVPPPSADDSFFELGGHSLLAARLVAEIATRTGVRVSLRDLLTRPRVQDLADHIDTLSPREVIPAQVIDDPGVPASLTQEQMWLAEQLDPTGSAYNVPMLWRITGDLDTTALRDAFENVIERHEILRTAFVDRDGELRQVVREPWRPELVEVDLTGSKEEIDAAVDAEAQQAFDLTAGKPLRVRLLNRAGDRLLLMCLHHLVCDGESLPVLIADLANVYAEKTGAPTQPRPEPVQFAEVAAEQRALLDGPVGADGLDYWTDYLAGAPARLELGTPPPSPRKPGAVTVPMPAAFAEDFLTAHQVSWYMVAATGVAAMLHRWSGSDDVTFGMPVANRMDERHAEVVGPCVNTVALRSKHKPGMTFTDLLGTMRESILDAIEYQEIPLSSVVNRLDPPRSPGRTPYLDVAIAILTNADDTTQFGSAATIASVPFDRFQHDRKFGITATFIENPDGLGAVLSYRGDRYTDGDVQAMAEWLGELFNQLPSLADESLEEVLPAATAQYRHFVRAHRAQQRADGVEHWVRTLTGAPSFPAITVPLQESSPGEVPITLAPNTLARLREVCEQHGLTWFMLSAASVAALLHRWTGADDLTFGVPVANRDDFPSVLGPCLNTVVLRSRRESQTTVLDLVRAMRDTVLDAFDHQEVPFEDLVDRLRPPRRAGWTPFIDTLLAVTTVAREPVTIGGLELTPLRLNHDGAAYMAKFGLTVGFEESGGTLTGTLFYRGDRYTAGEAARMASWLGRFVERLPEILDSKLSTVDVLGEEERAELRRFEHGVPAKPATTLIELFHGQVRQRPEAPAIRTASGVLTYREVADRAEAVANALRPHARGDQPVVALLLPRGTDLVVSMLGAWQAGFLYCPLDPEYPKARVDYILDDLDASVVIAADPAGIDRPVINPSTLDSMPHREPPRIDRELAAYVLYTSGTTGQPKGVEYSHRAIAQATQWHIEAFDVGPADRVSWIHSVAFDTTEWEIWQALCSGAELLPYEPSVVAPELTAWLAEQRVTLFCTPTPLAELMWAAKANLPDLRWMIFGGSALTVLPPPDTSYQICDSYGPTETYNTTLHTLDPRTADVLNCLGRPNAGNQVYVLDEAGQRAPIGMPGEIHIGGTSVAIGYWRREDLTRQRFSDRNPDGEPDWVYRTGDRGRWLPDGTLEYLGRLDRQVKIRGYRIEPQEIEDQLRRDPLIHQAAIHVFPGEAVPLVGYAVAHDPDRADTAAVLARLKLQLPEFMVPGAIVWLPELPLNHRGKLDTAALPKPGRDDLAAATPFAAPETGLERRIAAVWSGVLSLESVGAHDNFFDLGGNSLLLATLHARLQSALERTLPIRNLFEHPTVHTLAKALSGEEPAAQVDNVRDRAKLAQARRSRAARGGPR
jgi:amino acid adenylation domain-containing protein